MNTVGTIALYRRLWLPELIMLGSLVVLSTAVFSFTELDLAAARGFYYPGESNAWPVGKQPPWSLLYQAAPWVTGSLTVLALAALLAGTLKRRLRRVRLYGLFVLLSVVLGPGLIVNGILKDHWGRARPREIVQLGGTHEYSAPLVPGKARGKSFPCGHCSVGYLYAVGWFIWRRRKRALAVTSLVVGLVAGSLLGIGRMAAGAHFLSDMLWSGFIAFGVSWTLYYFILKIPAREDAPDGVRTLERESPLKQAVSVTAYSLVSAAVLLGGILAYPLDEDLRWSVERAKYANPPRALELLLDRIDVNLTLVAERDPLVRLRGHVHAFGLPTNDVLVTSEYIGGAVPLVRFRLDQRGWFTDLDGLLNVRVSAQDIERITVRVKEGDVTVRDRTGGGGRGGDPRLPELDVTTGRGRVELPPNRR